MKDKENDIEIRCTIACWKAYWVYFLSKLLTKLFFLSKFYFFFFFYLTIDRSWEQILSTLELGLTFFYSIKAWHANEFLYRVLKLGIRIWKYWGVIARTIKRNNRKEIKYIYLFLYLFFNVQFGRTLLIHCMLSLIPVC